MDLLLPIILGLLIALFVFGFIGGLAGAIVDGGREDRSLLANAGIGLVGSATGVLLWSAVDGRELQRLVGGLLASLLGAMVLLVVLRWIRRDRGGYVP